MNERVLQINCVYEKGSTGKITECLQKNLRQQGIEAYVFYGRKKGTPQDYITYVGNEVESKVSHALSMLTGIMYGGCLSETINIIHRIKKMNPDIVHLQCINGYFVNIYSLLKWLAKKRIPTVLSLHAEFMYTGNCGYALDCNKWKNDKGCFDCFQWRAETHSLFGDRTAIGWKKMKSAFEDFSTDKLEIVSVSPWLQSRAECSAILKRFRHRTIYNGVNTEIFKKTASFDNAKEKASKHIIFHATAFFSSDREHIKGGYYLIKLAECMKEENVEFWIAGDYDANITVPDNVKLLGKVNDQKVLASYYSKADVTVLVSKRETFSMVCAESLCCGTPVVGFYAGAPETIALREYSRFVPFADLESMREKILEVIGENFSGDAIMEAAHQRYSERKMTESYLAVYRKLLGGEDE